jgi:hypothetical protein
LFDYGGYPGHATRSAMYKRCNLIHVIQLQNAHSISAALGKYFLIINKDEQNNNENMSYQKKIYFKIFKHITTIL